MTDIVAILAKRNRLALEVASAITLMCERLGKLGGWDEREVIGITRQKRTIKVFPRAWLRRLEAAVDAGAFERLYVKEIVDRIVMTPERDGVETSGGGDAGAA